MTYLSELKHFQLNQFNESELLTFNEKRKLLKDSAKRKSRNRGKWWREVLYAYCKVCCDKTAIHGVRFLTDNTLLKFEKILWGIILLATTIVCGYAYKLLSERSQSTRVHTVVEDSVKPVFYIPFPAIGVCTRYRFNWSKMPAAELKFLPPNPSTNAIKTFREFFQRFEEFQFGKFEYFKDLEALDLKLINNISIIEVMRFLTYTCTDLFGTINGTCVWRKRVYNCCELFKLERTESGFCQVFNSAILPEMHERAIRDKYFPYRNSKSGEKSGLVVRLQLNSSQQRPGANVSNGIYLLIKKNEQWTASGTFINPETYSRVIITPEYTDSHQDIRTVTPEDRKCLFDDEVHHKFYKKIEGLRYWRANCNAQCHHDYVIQSCNCTLPYMFPDWANVSYPACTPSDFICLYNYRNVFVTDKRIFESDYIEDEKEQMLCNCMNSCDSIVFRSQVTSVFKQNSKPEVEFITLDIYYNSDYMIKYMMILSYTFVELIGNFGGIIGLFLGASLLSGVEIVYYLTIGFWMFLHKEKALDSKLKLKKKNFKVRPIKDGKKQTALEKF